MVEAQNEAKRRPRVRVLRVLAAVALLPLLALIGMSIASQSAPELGLREGRLTPLPDRPNGVSSVAEDPSKLVDSLPMHFEDVTRTRAALEAAVAELGGCRLLEAESTYLRFACASSVFRFQDDLELHVVPSARVIHVRAAARVGYSDMGVNRARVERLRAIWARRRDG